MVLNTWQFGAIRIVEANDITCYDTYIRQDAACEWNYFQLASGEIVAVANT